MRALLTLWLACIGVMAFSFGAQAQTSGGIVVPTFGTRGDVPDSLVEAFMASFRRQLAIETGLGIDPGDLITEGIASSLEPGFVGIIAQLGNGRYGVSGEIAEASVPTSSAPYVVTILIGDDQLGRSSDLLSQPLEPDDVRAGALSLARLVESFLDPADALPRGTATLFVNSQPGEAEIWIRGEVRGKTPTILENLAAGRYEVEFRKEGFLPGSESIVLEEGRTMFLDTFLAPVTGGSIQVTSEPQARVFLDGEFVGMTPLAVQALPGERAVRLEREGFESQVRSVLVRNFRVTRIDEELTPGANPLLYWNAPRGMLVSIDGLLRLDGYAEGLDPGLHQVDVRYGLERSRFTVLTPASGIYRLDIEARQIFPFGQ